MTTFKFRPPPQFVWLIYSVSPYELSEPNSSPSQFIEGVADSPEAVLEYLCNERKYVLRGDPIERKSGAEYGFKMSNSSYHTESCYIAVRTQVLTTLPAKEGSA